MSVEKPQLMVFAARFNTAQTSAEFLLGMAAHAGSSAYRMGVEPRKIMEPTARKAILGQGSFVQRDATKKIIRGSGSKRAKAAAVEWCENKGWDVGGDDNQADALVIWEYARRYVLSRQQWGQWQK